MAVLMGATSTPIINYAATSISARFDASECTYAGTVTQAYKPNSSGHGGLVRQRISWEVVRDTNGTYWINIEGNWHEVRSAERKVQNITYYYYANGYYFNF